MWGGKKRDRARHRENARKAEWSDSGREHEGENAVSFQSACSCSVTSAASQFKPIRPIFSCHLPVNFLAFLERPSDRLNSRPRTTAGKSTNPQTWLFDRKMLRRWALVMIKKNVYVHIHTYIYTYTYTFDSNANVLMKGPLVGPRRLLFMHDHVRMPLSNDMYGSLLIRNIDISD